MNRRHIKSWLIWLALFNWPAVLIWIPFFRILCFFPLLLWINIPALFLGLATVVGKPHYDIQEFGAVPKTPLAWILIVAFWSLAALGMAAATAYYPGLVYRKPRRPE
jgi:hypothetical protein